MRWFGFEMCLSLAAAAIFALKGEWHDVFILFINMVGIQMRRFCTPEWWLMHYPIAFELSETLLNACLPLWLLLESSQTSQPNWPFKAVCFLAHLRLSLRIFITIVQHTLCELGAHYLRAVGFGQEERSALIDCWRQMNKSIESRGAIGLAFGPTLIGHIFAQEPIEVRIDRIAPRFDMSSCNGDACSVCHEQLSTGGQCRKLACGHTFHAKCIDDWLRDPSRRTCPMCRAPVALREHDGVDLSRILRGITRGQSQFIASLIEGYFMVGGTSRHFANGHTPQQGGAASPEPVPIIIPAESFAPNIPPEFRMVLTPHESQGQESESEGEMTDSDFAAVEMVMRFRQRQEEAAEDSFLDPNGPEIRGVQLSPSDDEDVPPSPRQSQATTDTSLRQRTHSAAI